MTAKEILDRLSKLYRIYLDGDMKPVKGYDDTFYDGVLWAFARLKEKQPSDESEVVEEIEKPFITKCRENAIKDNLPLYFVYYEETGVFEVYVTETRELFEKKRCYKHLPDYAFSDMVNNYLEWYKEYSKYGVDKRT
jgi:hypothetical protein